LNLCEECVESRSLDLGGIRLYKMSLNINLTYLKCHCQPKLLLIPPYSQD
jgi:hypothetical protein